MKELIIVCKSCAARLKVTKPSSLGKMLACPKCGTMLEIKPKHKLKAQADIQPEKLKSPEEKSKRETIENGPVAESPSSGQPLKTVLTETDFDEIDSLLERQKTQLDPFERKIVQPQSGEQIGEIQKVDQEPKPGPPKKTAAKERFRSPPPSNESKTPTAIGDPSPLLPDDQWVSPESRRRRKRLVVFSLIASGVVLVALMLAAWFNSAKVVPPVAELGAPEPNQGVVDEAVDQQQPEQAAFNDQGLAGVEEPDNQPIPPRDEPIPALDNQVQIELQADNLPADPQIFAGEAKNDNRSADLGRQSDAETSDGVDRLAEEPAKRDDSVSREKETAEREATEREATEREAAEREAAEREAAEREATRLAELLESSGFAANTMRDIASRHREDQRQGIPKYFIEQTPVEIPEMDRLLSTPLPRMDYQQIKLSVIAQDLTNITGIPITFEPFSILAQIGTINPKITYQAEGTTIGEALDQLLEEVGLQRLMLENEGILIAAIDHDEYLMKEYELPNFRFEEPAEREAAQKEFVLGTKNLIAPESWERQPDPARIWLEDGSLKVFNHPHAHFQLGQLISKIDAAFSLSVDPLDLNAQGLLRTRTDLIVPRLNQPARLEHQFSQTLLSFLAQMEQQSGVTMLADWDGLSQLGWSPLSTVPGTLVEPTVKEVLQQLGSALGITYVAIDDQTIFLTTYERAAEQTDLEVYHFGQILSGKLNENQALELLNKGIIEELRQPAVRIIYEPKYRSLIVVAPQSIQRKIADIIKALAEI